VEKSKKRGKNNRRKGGGAGRENTKARIRHALLLPAAAL